jgi:hypothetical protein
MLFEDMVDHGQPRAVTLGARWRLRLARGFLWLEPPSITQAFDFQLDIGDTIDLPIPGWRVRMGSTLDPTPHLRWSWRSPPGARLRVRSVDSDDRIGVDRRGPRVAEMLARRLPRHLRPVWPVFCEDDRIYWIPGVWHDPAVEDREGHVVEVMRCGQAAGHI